MWVMTTRGFYSVVQHREEPTKVMIRARCKEDIDALADLLPNAKPFELLTSDYAWRIVTTQAEWIEALVQMSLEVDYANFKNAVESPKHQNAYMNVWCDLLALDDRHNSKESEDFGYWTYGGKDYLYDDWGAYTSDVPLGKGKRDEPIDEVDYEAEWERGAPLAQPPEAA